MYKARLEIWKVRKNCSEAQTRAIVRKKKTRDALGKSAGFRIGGRRIMWERISSYCKRKRWSLDAAIDEQDSIGTSTPSDVSCFTPVRSPTPLPLEDNQHPS